TPGAETLVASNITDTKDTFVSLKPGTTYYFKIAAVNGSGTGPLSAEVSATPTPPSAPAGLSATPGNGQVALSWSASTGAGSYNVYQGSTPGGEAATPVATGLTATNFNVTGLSNGSTYYFKVAAVTNGVAGPLSTEVSTAPGPALAPTNVTATAGSGSVTLRWTASPNATTYYIYKSTTAGGEAPPAVTSASGSSTSITIGGLSNGTTYFFKIKASNGGGTSAYSNEASTIAGPALAPTNVTASAAATPGRVTLNWTASANATTYYIYKSTTSGGEAPPAVLAVSGGSSTTATVTGLTSGTRYFFEIKASNGDGVSAYSNEASATPN
ncbi:MAG TPA: fibronectin type III domain-containing protein, partial [Nevskia sp.]|nr:fibronectin type III domain-containing protein [Nevskia sp.]